MNANFVTLVGRLGQDPEVSALQNGDTVCNFSMAMTEYYKKDDQKDFSEETTWISVTAWRKLGEICAQYLEKGSQCYIEGKLQTEKWDDKDTGQKRYRTKVRVDNVQFLGSPRGGKPPIDRTQPPEQDEFDDDIPF